MCVNAKMSLAFSKKLTHKVNVFLIKIPVGFFMETEELAVIFIKTSREPSLAQVMLKNAVRGPPQARGQDCSLQRLWTMWRPQSHTDPLPSVDLTCVTTNDITVR